jgi:hypothetical protein
MKSGILVINKVKPTIPIRAESRPIFSESKSIEGAWMFFGDLNGYQILIAQFVDNQDFGGKLCHERSIIRVQSYPVQETKTSSTSKQARGRQ